jgi:hypothetical protein
MQMQNSSRLITRRGLLSNVGRLTAAALGASLLPQNVQRALATPFRRGSFADIKHVVLLMQETVPSITILGQWPESVGSAILPR